MLLHRATGASPENLNRNDATRKQDEGRESKPPIHVDQHDKRKNNRNRVLEDIAAYLCQRHLHRHGVITDPRHQNPGLHAIKEIHGLVYYFAEKLVSNVGHGAVTDPIHVVGTAVTENATRGHHCRNEQADKENRIYRPAGIE